jgi:HJR/Mrr/RecB family endonuclease
MSSKDHYSYVREVRGALDELKKNKPTLNDFGISEKEYKQIRHSYIGEKNKNIITWFLTLLGIIIYAFYEIDGSFFSAIGYSFLLMVCILPPLIIAFPTFLFVEFLDDYLIEKSTTPKEKKIKKQAKKFEAAKKSHDEKVKNLIELAENIIDRRWKGYNGLKFERMLCNLFKKHGYKASRTSATGDGGYDIEYQDKEGQRVLVECKAHKKPVGVAVARQLYGVLLHENAEKGVIASVSGFTNGVYDFIADKPIELLSLRSIIKMTKEIEL